MSNSCPFCQEIPIIYFEYLCKSSQIIVKFSSTSLVKVEESGVIKVLCGLMGTFKFLVVLLRLMPKGLLPDEDILTT